MKDKLRTFTDEEIANTQSIFIKAIIDNQIDDELALNSMALLVAGNLAKSGMTELGFQEVLANIYEVFKVLSSKNETA